MSQFEETTLLKGGKRMSQRITPETLAAIRQRAESATPGPWTKDTVPSNYGYSYEVFNGHHVKVNNFENDALFIANARQDIPMLLAEVDALRTELERIQEAETERLRSEHYFEHAPKGTDLL